MFTTHCMPKLAAIALAVAALMGTLLASPAPAAEPKGGTSAFEGSSGMVVFDGAQVALVAGHGGYQGTWTHR
jgi:hypothetical protein